MRSLPRLFTLLFVLSGIAGLVHETLWARYLGIVLGHSAYGQILTLIVYMGGIGLGSAIAGRWMRRLERPLFAYVLVELGIGAGGFLFHHEFLALRGLLLDSGWLVGSSDVFATSLSVAMGIVLTLPFAILIGMTFPLATGYLIRLRKDDGADSIARLYFGNSLGAVLGAVANSYFLIPSLGTHGALMVAGALNTGVGILAWLADRRLATGGVEADAKAGPSSSKASPPVAALSRGRVRLLLAAAFVTGLSSFFYEIGWIRYLALLLGSSTHAFDLMVAAFVLGLAGGAWTVHRHPRMDLVKALVVAQICMAGAAVLGVIGYEPVFRIANDLNLIFQRTEESYPIVMAARFLLSLAVMLPASWFAGMTLPLICRHLIGQGEDEGTTGKVYAWNTSGAIVAAAIGGLVLMPVLGPFRLVGAGAAVDLVLALVLMGAWGFRKFQIGQILAGISGVLVVAGLWIEPAPWIVAAGSFRGRVAFHAPEDELLLHGRTASIRIMKEKDFIILSTNGKSDASLRASGAMVGPGDALTQSLMAWIARAYQVGPYRAAMVGMGSGQSAQTLLEDDRCRSLDLVEIEPAVHEASRWFYPRNRLVYDDPRSHVHFQDARIFFARQKMTYDLVVSEPSNPWVSGVSSLFTEEFYRETASRMSERGILVQWLHVYEMRSDALRSVLRTIRTVFPHAAVLTTPNNDDFYILASKAPLNTNPELTGTVDTIQLAAGGLSRRDVGRPLEILRDESIDLLSAGAPVNSEFHPYVDGQVERAFFLRTHATLLSEVEGGSLWLDGMWTPKGAVADLPPLGRRSLLVRGLPGEDARRGFRRLLSRPDSIHRVERMWAYSQFRTVFPTWSWSDPEVAAMVGSFKRHIDSIRDTSGDADLFRWNFQWATGHEDSALAELRKSMRHLPPDLAPENLRDIYGFLLATGERSQVSGFREQAYQKQPLLAERYDFKFLDELSRRMEGGAVPSP